VEGGQGPVLTAATSLPS